MGEGSFDVDVTDEDSAVRLRLAGELDLATVGRLEHALAPVIGDERTPAQRIIVDMTALEFADLAGLRPLLAARSDLAKRGGTVSFVHPPYPVRRILELLDTTWVPTPGSA